MENYFLMEHEEEFENAVAAAFEDEEEDFCGFATAEEDVPDGSLEYLIEHISSRKRELSRRFTTRATTAQEVTCVIRDARLLYTVEFTTALTNADEEIDRALCLTQWDTRATAAILAERECEIEIDNNAIGHLRLVAENTQYEELCTTLLMGWYMESILERLEFLDPVRKGRMAITWEPGSHVVKIKKNAPA